MPYSPLSVELPSDAIGRRFMGVSGKLFAGTTSPDNADEAMLHVLLVDANNDPLITTNGLKVHGPAAHDAAGAGGPLMIGGFSAATSPGSTSTDGDAVNAWFFRNGAQAVVLTSAGEPITGNTANGLDVDVTRRAKESLTASSPAAATVGTSSAEAVAANASRKGLVLVNTSANTISLAFGAAAVLNSGITLLPGSSYTMGEYDFTTAQVRAIASAASSNLAIQEFV